MLIEEMGQILTREDRDAAERVKESLLRDGVQFVMDINLLEIRKENGEKILRFECGGDPAKHWVDEILVGAGRAPNVQGLGLEAAGV